MKRRADGQLDNFLPSIKKLYIEHKEAAEELEHYKEKVSLLQRRISAVSTSEELPRYHRVLIF